MSTDSLHEFGLPFYAIDALKAVFKQYSSIEKVRIYGSRAKGNYRPGSDIDLCLIAPTCTLRDLSKIDEQIDYLCLPWTVDLSLLHQIDNPDLLEHIRQVGIDF